MAERSPKKNRSRPLTLEQAWGEIKALKSQLKNLSVTVGRLKDILQVEDNWHSHISRWMKKSVILWTDGAEFTGVLLWTDRYNLGLEIDGEESIFNKGQIVRIKRASD